MEAIAKLGQAKGSYLRLRMGSLKKAQGTAVVLWLPSVLNFQKEKHTMPLDKIINAARESLGLWKDIKNIREESKGRYDFIYAVDFETRLNLDLLSAIKQGGFTGEKQAAAPGFAELAAAFETSAALALLAGNARENYRSLVELLDKYWDWESGVNIENEDDAKEAATNPEDVLDALSFAVRKMEALKRIALIAAAEADFLKKIKVETRLNNINKSLCSVRNSLKKVIEQIKHE